MELKTCMLVKVHLIYTFLIQHILYYKKGEYYNETKLLQYLIHLRVVTIYNAYTPVVLSRFSRTYFHLSPLGHKK